MNKLVLKNDSADCGTWFFTASAFAAVGLLCFGGLIAANVYDPKALWMGPNVTAPQTIYFIFEGFMLLVALGMTCLAVLKGRQFFDSSDQLIIDETGIHDLRPDGDEILWSEVDGISDWALSSGGIITAAQLHVRTRDGETVAIDVLGLDQDHKAILQAARQFLKVAR
jgi:hypothetical protein